MNERSYIRIREPFTSPRMYDIAQRLSGHEVVVVVQHLVEDAHAFLLALHLLVDAHVAAARQEVAVDQVPEPCLKAIIHLYLPLYSC